MARVHSFPPIEGAYPRTLILGTMPGIASLTASQYYAHPRNAFWTILADVLGFDAQLDYPARTRLLVGAGIAVWDVLRSCERHGSLDSNIEASSTVANNFGGFFSRHPQIQWVFFNGAHAEALYRRHVLRTLPEAPERQYMRLPSTSPANASISLSHKTQTWRAAIGATVQRTTHACHAQGNLIGPPSRRI